MRTRPTSARHLVAAIACALASITAQEHDRGSGTADPGQSREPRPVDAGELMCVFELSSGRLYAVEIATDRAPFTVHESPRRPRVLARLDRDHVLLERVDAPVGLFVVDLTKSDARPCATGWHVQFVGVHEHEVFYLGNEDGRLTAIDWRRPDAEPRKVSTTSFDQIVVFTPERVIGFAPRVRRPFATTPKSEESGIVELRFDGRGQRVVWPLTYEEVLHAPNLAVTDDGAMLAIGSVEDGEGVLRVVDLQSATSFEPWRGIPVRNSALSSFLPTLRVGFAANGDVITAESRVEPATPDRSEGLPDLRHVFVHRSLETGETTRVEDLGPAGLSPPAPPGAPDYAPTPPGPMSIERADGEVRLLDDQLGVRERISTDEWATKPLGLSDLDARHAIANDDGRTVLLRAGDPEPRVLFDRPTAYAPWAVAWLPAAGKR